MDPAAGTLPRISWEVGLSGDTGGRLTAPERLWDCLRRYSDTILDGTATVDVRLLDRSTEVLSHPYLNLLNGAYIVESVRECERLGFAAAMIAPAIDPALAEARATVRMPVVGSFEAAMTASQFLGRRVGVIAVNPGYTAAIEDDLRRYGLEGRLVATRPVRTMPLSYSDIEAALDGDAGALAASIEATATALIADGADVIVSCCQFYGAALWAGGVTQWLPQDVPFVDCAAAGLTMARALALLRSGVGLEKSGAPTSPFRQAGDRLLALATEHSPSSTLAPGGPVA